MVLFLIILRFTYKPIVFGSKSLSFDKKNKQALYFINDNKLKCLITAFLSIFFLQLHAQSESVEKKKENAVNSQKVETKEEKKETKKDENENERKKHEDLETELELYPFNVIVPSDPVVKNEVMFDYHLFNATEKMVGGVRFFADANMHWAKMRDMKDLIMYTEMYYGFKNFQLGAEIGSVTGEEYMSIGPQFASYDGKLFKRVSVISRVLPDYVIGYEYTTQEADILRKVKISSTGMGRLVIPSNQTVIQASIWISFESIKGLYFGLEYEHNNATYFNQIRFETNNELFFGIKAELH